MLFYNCIMFFFFANVGYFHTSQVNNLKMYIFRVVSPQTSGMTLMLRQEILRRIYCVYKQFSSTAKDFGTVLHTH